MFVFGNRENFVLELTLKPRLPYASQVLGLKMCTAKTGYFVGGGDSGHGGSGGGGSSSDGGSGVCLCVGMSVDAMCVSMCFILLSLLV